MAPARPAFIATVRMNTVAVQTEISLLRRHVRPGSLFILLLVYAGALAVLERHPEIAPFIDAPRFLVFLAMATFGTIFVRPFAGGLSERWFHYVHATSLQSVLFHKNVAALCIAGTAVVVAGGLATALFGMTLVDVAAVSSYASTSLATLVQVGNLLFMRTGGTPSPDHRIASLVLYGLALGASSLPYVVFQFLPAPAAFSSVYTGAALVCWYRVSIPRTARRIEREKSRFLFP